MRHMTTALLVIAALGLGAPALAQATGTERDSATKTEHGQMPVETHLKAAGYDLMQVRQMMQAKNDAKAREFMTSARNHIQMAEDAAPTSLAGQIRRIESSLEQAEKVARTDMKKANQQVAQADTELQKLIKQHGGM